MTRVYFLLFSYLFMVSLANAQVDTNKLFYAKNIESDAFVELASSVIQVNGNAGMNIDFSANCLLQHKYYLGASYTQLANLEQIYSAKKPAGAAGLAYNKETTIKYQTAGIRVGYILFEDQKIISFSPDLTVGWAGVNLITEDNEAKINGAYISPALKGVFNVSDYFRIGLALNYRAFIFKAFDSTDNPGNIYATQLKTKSLNGVGGGVFLRIGQF